MLAGIKRPRGISALERGGRELYFVGAGGSSVLTAPVQASGEPLQVGAAKQLFQREGAAGYDVARDGQGFLAIVSMRNVDGHTGLVTRLRPSRVIRQC